MHQKKTIMIVDDDADLRGALAEQLELHEDFRPQQADCAGEGLKLALESQADIVLLSMKLPDMDSAAACRMMRDAGMRAPVILLAAANEDSQALLGLDAGATDYITKPFKFSVLLARMRAHLRSHEQSEDANFQIGPYEFRPAAKMLVDGEGRKVRLTEKETSILRYLYRAGEKPVQRDELLREVWGYNSNVSTHTLETHVYRLRQKIELDPQNARLLLTDLGGYRLQP
jgi:DNA-binding response OmpR family regulator